MTGGNRKLSKIILYIDMMGHGGAQRVMLTLAEYFNKSGAKVILINDFQLSSDIPQYSVPFYIEQIYLRKKLNGSRIWKNAERIRVFRNIVKREKPEIILSFLGRPNERMLLSTFGLPCKKVVSVRNDPNREYGKGGIKKWFARQLFRFADGVVFQTEDAGNYFPDTVRRRSSIILNPVKDGFYQIKRKASTGKIITFGRLEKQKNHRMLIQVFARLTEEFPEIRLFIYGEGSLRPELEKLIHRLELDGRAFLPGDTDHVERHLSDSEIFVLSSDFEGMPNALMEAMAAGLPCVSTDCPCGGARMLIRDRENGMLVPTGDENAMEKAIRTLLLDKKFAEKAGKAANASAKAFKAEKIFEQWERYLIRVLES